MSAKLRERLCERLEGEQGLFLTLTYRRGEYANPEDLLDRSSEERHVRRFMESLGKHLGENLSGRWVRKLEFQHGGWVHWHVILVGVTFIDHADLTRIWGHGFTYVNRINRKRVHYFAKYLCKPGESVPAWVYARPVGSIRVIASSPGFWNDPREGRSERRSGFRLIGFYRTIGDAVDAAKEHCTMVDERGHHHRINEPIHQIVAAVLSSGGSFHESERPGWLLCTGLIRRHQATSRPGAAEGRHRPLYLKKDEKPPTLLTSWRLLHLLEASTDVPGFAFDRDMGLSLAA